MRGNWKNCTLFRDTIRTLIANCQERTRDNVFFINFRKEKASRINLILFLCIFHVPYKKVYIWILKN